MIKKALPAVLAATVLGGVSATAQAMEISGNVALTSDYRFRGISQSDESIAIQGGFDLGFENGIYLGTWGSSVDFDTNGDGFDGSLELDYYAGWAGSISDNIGIDVGILYYDYPGDDDAEGDYLEFYGSVSLWDVSLGLAYSDDYYGETGEFFYYSADYSLGLTDNLSLDLHAGYNDLDEEGFLSDGATSYTDYSAALTLSWLAVDWSLAWVGTDLDEDEVFGTDWGDDTVVFTVSKSM
ncbi:hypothetical protein E4634_07080 [Mangrovimicrobium sediminis]|uniref:TIGR02001 family outer membrane protein n=1 Tax=Mangrovimicrobium sediminis TaxID=2562682 RepID=A0A4Z0M375_9GAMM|nr:TorF family putative porin [Haliea sp. SAOS-164]TGD73897.1 hypothetical protein E4634_07080 [Haliea sp. SAOS-164]